MIKKSFIYIFLFNVILLSGCATVNHVPLSKENSASIKSVYINPDIKVPPTMDVVASGTQLGIGFGLVGYLIASDINIKKSASTLKFAEKNEIDIRKIVYQKWMSQLAEKSKFKLSSQPIDTILTTDIHLYGISTPNAFSTDYKPVLTLNAKLVRNKQIIWEHREEVVAYTEGMPRYKMDEIMNDPKKLYAMWDKASEKVINSLLAQMNK